jgi:hypothetical protein
MMSAKKNGAGKLVLGGVAVVAGIGALVAIALGGSTVAAVPFTEVAAQSGRVQVYGKLDKTSIRPIRGANLVAFDLLEEEGTKENKHLTGRRIAVEYNNPSVGLPANFPAASHARAIGLYDPSSKKIVSTEVVTKCPSKYEENGLDPATKVALKAWKDSTGTGKTEGAYAPAPAAPAPAAPARPAVVPASISFAAPRP